MEEALLLLEPGKKKERYHWCPVGRNYTIIEFKHDVRWLLVAQLYVKSSESESNQCKALKFVLSNSAV
jgi:hypothetical protein